MSTRLVIFDLDGTLIDSAAEIAEAINDLLRHQSLPELPLEVIRGLIGHGARATIAKAVALSAGSAPTEGALDELLIAYGAFFLARCGSHSSVYPEVRSTLERLDRMGVKLALVTNKEECFTRPLLDAHGLLEWFDPVISGDTLRTSKPDAAPLEHCMRLRGVHREHTLMVGDSLIDLGAGRAAGVRVMLVAHGYDRSARREAGPDGWIESFSELIHYVDHGALRPLAPLMGVHHVDDFSSVRCDE